MNAIDAVEGTVKYIVSGLHQLWIEHQLDDSEYIRTIRSVLDSTDTLLQDNREIIDDPQILKGVLYSFSKELWMKHVEKREASDQPSEKNPDEIEYREYYYDYIYDHDVYPH